MIGVALRIGGGGMRPVAMMVMGRASMVVRCAVVVMVMGRGHVSRWRMIMG